MFRFVLGEMKEWRNKEHHKPLILKGSRQVGKTWLMKEFSKEFDDSIYCNFENMNQISSVFKTSLDPNVIIANLSLLFGKKIEVGKTLIIFDEIQECPEALTSLKYFHEELPGMDIVSAGSLLGTYLSEISYPVGMVDIIDVYPMTFEEFLIEVSPELADFYKSITADTVIPDAIHSRFLEVMDIYFIVGGMPEAVSIYSKNRNVNEVRYIERTINEMTKNDMLKHNTKIDAAKILEIYESLPSQLAKENRKFVFTAVRGSARAREYGNSIIWLKEAGIVEQVFNVSKAYYPLEAYKDPMEFKLYHYDIGLLTNIAAIDPSYIIQGIEFFFKGAIAENFVLLELRHNISENVFYYSHNNNLEVDFLIQKPEGIIPIEVKSGMALKSASFSTFMEKNGFDKGIKFSRMPILIRDSVVNIPLYLAGKADQLFR